MKHTIIWECSLPKPDTLTLETRLENASTLSVSDLRSIEARFRAIGSCKLSYYFPSKHECERFIENVSWAEKKYRIFLPTLTKDSTYAEVASRIYRLYEKTDGCRATRLMFRFLKPLRKLSETTFDQSNRQLLKERAYRRYVLTVHDFNDVINTLYPELLHQEYPPYVYRQCKELQSETILRIPYRCEKFINASAPLFAPHKRNEPYTKEQQDVSYTFRKIIHVFKELFVDPYHCLWKEIEDQQKAQEKEMARQKASAPV